MQLILFSLIESQSKHNIFEKSNDLIDMVMRDDIREKLRQVVDELGNYMGKGVEEGVEGLEGDGGSKLSDLEGIFKSFGEDGGIFEGLGSDKSSGGEGDDLRGNLGGRPNFASIQENLDKMLKN